ncbi:hypothetical protein LINPERHAP1_LOCUS27389 [Linum perenne]
MTVLQDWRKAKAKGTADLTPTPPAPVRCVKWHPPPVMRLKCNVDAAFREQQRMWGWGVALRDHAGTLVAYRTGWQRGTPEIREGEAMALLDALRWAAANSLGPTKFEVDSEEVAVAVMSHTKDDTEFGHIIELCRELFVLQRHFEIGSVRRDRNQVAHELAQRSFSFASPFGGHAPPSWLECTLANMCTNLDH